MAKFLGLSSFDKTVLVLAMAVATACAQKVGTNGVDAVEGGATNDVVGTNGVATPPSSMMRMRPTVTDGERLVLQGSVTDEDIVKGCRLESVTTNGDYSFAMPTNGEMVGNWHLCGAYEDVIRVGLEGFAFPFGTNLCDHLLASVWGEARPRLKSNLALVAVGAPMSVLPGVSRFWTATTTNDTYLLTWQDLALGRIPAPTNTSYLLPLTSYLASAQLELMRNGDFITRSNDVAWTYRRINPDDWDGDGWLNEVDANPLVFNEGGFGPHQAIPTGDDTNFYYWVDLVVSNADARVQFVGDRASDLEDPVFIARAGETNRVALLIGKTYEAHCDMPLFCVSRESDEVEVWGIDDGLGFRWPITLTFVSAGGPRLLFAPRLGAVGGGAVSPQVEPIRAGGGSFTCERQVCCGYTTSNGTPVFYCDGTCGCGGCSSGAIGYGYVGYYLENLGCWSCSCGPHEDPGGGDEPSADPSGPSVSAKFTKEAIIFEDAYENAPGVTVPRRSTETEVEFYVYGGTNGGSYAFSIVNGDKLTRIGGGFLPKNGTVEAGESFRIKARYQAQLASGSTNDIIAKAEFTENETGQRLSDETSKLTAVKVEVWPSLHALQNDCHYRRKVGVGEVVNCKARPNVAGFHWQGGDGTVNGSGVDCQYVCPLHAENSQLKIIGDGCEYTPRIFVVEPNGVLASEVGFQTYETRPGHAGGITLTMSLQALPLDVNFSGIMIEEIPDAEATREGYFADTYFMRDWYHGTGQGAGDWRNVMGDNCFLHDEAGFRAELPQLDARGFVSPSGTNGWITGGMTWSVPCGWGSLGMEEGDDPVGLFATGALQEFGIESSGNCEVRKHANVIRREVTGRVILNGVEMA